VLRSIDSAASYPWAVTPRREAHRLAFSDHLEHANKGAAIERAVGLREARLAAGEECPASCPAPAARDRDRGPEPTARLAPRLGEVPPTPPPPAPPKPQHQYRVEHFTPIGSIIDVLI